MYTSKLYRKKWVGARKGGGGGGGGGGGSWKSKIEKVKFFTQGPTKIFYSEPNQNFLH